MLRSLFSKIVISIFLLCSITTSELFALQLGTGDNANKVEFVQITSSVKKVTCGTFHTLFIKDDNSLWAMGSNEFNQISEAPVAEYMLPEKIMDNVLDVSAGSDFTMVLSEKHELYIWGDFDRCGVDNEIMGSSKILDADVDSISAGRTCAFYVKNGNAYGVGTSYDGIFSLSVTQYEPQLIMNNVKKIKAVGNSILLLTESNQLYCLGKFALTEEGWQTYHSPELITSDVIDMADGFFIDKNLNLYAFGFTGYGALGVDDSQIFINPTLIMSNVVSVSSQREHSLILDMNNRLFTSGGDYPGITSALGTGREEPTYQFLCICDQVKYIETGLYYSMVIKTDGTLWGCGANNRNNGGL